MVASVHQRARHSCVSIESFARFAPSHLGARTRSRAHATRSLRSL